MMSDFASWLAQLGLDRYTALFAEHDVDFEVLSELTEQDLEKLGLSLGHRKKLLKAMAAHQNADIQPTARVTATSADTSKSIPVAERRQLTVMFADLVGSTELSSRLDPEDLRELILAYQNTVAGEISRYQGHVAKFMGDGVLAYFGWPRAYEDAAERAVRSGLAVIAAIANLRTSDGQILAARVGIATGIVVVGDLIGAGAAQEESVVGETPNLAARLQALAEPGDVVISASTRRLCGEVFELQALGPQMLKGFADSVEVYRVKSENRFDSRFAALHGAKMTALVGRGLELELLRKRWSLTLDGTGQVVFLGGEPGIGKSRLIQGLQEHISEQAHIKIRYQCSPYNSSSALYPVLQQLQYAAGFKRSDTNADKLDKLALLLGGTKPANSTAVPLIAALLSLDAGNRFPSVMMNPQKQKEETLLALADYVLEPAVEKPVLILLEDAHWIDPTSQELFELIVSKMAIRTVLIVITHRPEYQPPWKDLDHVTEITLTRLGRRDVVAIIERITGGAPLPDDVLNQIIAKTDGIPLFAEELTKAVLESQLVVRRGAGFELAGVKANFAVPSTLQDSLMARLDRLSPVKEVAQIGACIGRVFSHTLIAGVALLSDDKLSEALSQLVDSELIERDGSPPNAQYCFKHALIQDAAYNSLLKSRRYQLHQSIANHLLAKDPTIARTEPELLAHHFTAAGLYAAAVKYWLEAGNKAAQGFAHDEAVSHLQRGLEAVAMLSDDPNKALQEYHLLIAQVRSYRMLGQYKKALAALDRAEGLSSYNLPQQALAEIYHLRGNTYFPMGNFDACHSAHQKALQFAQTTQSLDYEARAYSGLGDASFLNGQVDQAIFYHDRCFTLAQQHGFGEIKASSLHVRGLCHYYQNNIAESIADCQECIEISLQQSYFRAEVSARHAILLPLWETGDLTKVIECAEAGAASVDRTGIRNFKPFSLIFWARALVSAGDFKQGIVLAREAAELALKEGRAFAGPWALGNLAYLAKDRQEQEKALAEGEDIIRAKCLSHCAWWFYRDAMEVCLDSAQWERAQYYADALAAYAAEIPPWCEFFIARGRVLSAWGQSRSSANIRSRLIQLSEQSNQYGFVTPKQAIERALTASMLND